MVISGSVGRPYDRCEGVVGLLRVYLSGSVRVSSAREGVVGHSKPASSGHLKTSHLEGGSLPVLSKNSSGFQDARAASLVIFSALADTPIAGGYRGWKGMLSGEWTGSTCL